MNHNINKEVINNIQVSYLNVPLAIFLIGPNGSGKSTLRKYLDLSDIQTNIDPDMLNKIYLSNPLNKNNLFDSSKHALRMYHEAISKRLNVCLESTLAGKGTMQRIKEAKDNGYFTIAYYVLLNSVDLNIERIVNRVQRGGHSIPEDIIQKRYIESPKNLISIQTQFDILHIIDNSEPYFRTQFSKINGEFKKVANQLEPMALNLYNQVLVPLAKE